MNLIVINRLLVITSEEREEQKQKKRIKEGIFFVKKLYFYFSINLFFVKFISTTRYEFFQLFVVFFLYRKKFMKKENFKIVKIKLV